MDYANLNSPRHVVTPDHHSIKTASDIQEICYEFFLNSGITTFAYGRLYDNNHAYGLNSNPDLQLSHLNNGHLIIPPLPRPMVGNRCQFVLSAQTASPVFAPAIKNYQNRLGLDYPYFIIERYSTFSDVYFFCTSLGNENIINFYLNEQHYIEKFKQFFHSHTKKLLKEAEQNRLIIPADLVPQIDWKNNSPSSSELQPKKYTVHSNNNEICFTLKEAECLKYLSLGADNKSIARHMGISWRTVEFHLDSIKKKTGVNNKAEILFFLHSLGVPLRFW